MEKFYWGITKKYIAMFGALFDDIHVDVEGKDIRVPISYAPKEKFMQYFQSRPDLSSTTIETVLPRIGFELVTVSFSPERNLNPTNKISPCNQDPRMFTFNRVPYDFSFSLYVATKTFEDSLRIAEQILPLFSPSYNILLKEFPECNQSVDIPITLTAPSFNIDYEGSFDTKRVISWQMDFTMKGYYYRNIKTQARIQKAVAELFPAGIMDDLKDDVVVQRILEDHAE